MSAPAERPGWTPGPWHVDPRTDGRSRDYIRCGRKTGPYGLAVARVSSTAISRSEVDANARLIASAPALAEALERCERELRRMREMLASDARPGHVDHISKSDAAGWAHTLACVAHDALAAAKGAKP